MTEFTELDLKKDIADMDGEEAKKTLTEFMEAHKKNQTAYDAVVEEREEVESDYQEQLEEYEEKMAEFRQKRAEEASEYVNMPADLIAERFEYSEIEQIIAEAEESAEFTEEEPTDEDDEDDDRLTTFSEKEQKGRLEGDGGRASGSRDRALDALKNKNFPVSE